MSPRVPPQDAAIDAADISEYFANQDDFALEMRCLLASHRRGFKSEGHAGSYLDPGTGKPRQFDLRIRKERGLHTVWIAAECKSLKITYPLVISTVPRARDEATHSVIELGRERVALLRSPSFVFKLDEPVGKSAVQIGRRGDQFSASDSEAYAKWSQAIESASDLVRAAWLHRGKGFILPVLVISNETLWIVPYSAEGVPGNPQRAEETTLYVGRTLTTTTAARELSYPMGHLWICTEGGFENLLDRIANEAQVWDDIFDTN